MATDDEIKCSNSYEDFEPLCKWQRQDDLDILEVHLPGFKIEELKVRVIRNNVLLITGERVMNNDVRSRFQKEIKISKKIDKEKVHAKFVKAGILYVTLPKKTTTLASNYLARDLQSSSSFMKFNIGRNWIVRFIAILLATAFGFLACRFFFCRS